MGGGGEERMIFDRFNKLTPAEDERLALLEEECAEVVQAIAKIRRHGYESDNKGKLGHTNRMALEFELGHVFSAVGMLQRAADIKYTEVMTYAGAKRETVKEWLHHQPEEVL
jgi:NTP pyrophosphatase (non-canonical NTP hydrolase)